MSRQEKLFISELKRKLAVIFHHWNIYNGNYNGKIEVLKCITPFWQNKNMTALILMYTLEKCKFANKPKQNIPSLEISKSWQKIKQFQKLIRIEYGITEQIGYQVHR